jgi:hypothetical protein
MKGDKLKEEFVKRISKKYRELYEWVFSIYFRQLP